MSAELAEAATHADFNLIRYAQVWEDADILLAALDIQPTDVCLSIASAGDNVLSLISRSPARVIALDLSPAQLACMELRVAAFRQLEYPTILELIGIKHSENRSDHYQKCRINLCEGTRAFWDSHPEWIAQGIGHVGKFEHYFSVFRRFILPLVMNRKKVDALLSPKSKEDRSRFYHEAIDSSRWRMLFHLFFSRTVMGWKGRDPSFFRYVEGTVSDRILTRLRHALIELEPDKNPYLQWILLGTYRTVLPHYLREENYESIRRNLDRLEWHESSIESYLEGAPDLISKFNLSDIFEYMSEANTHAILEKIGQTAKKGSRLAYWNMLAPRCVPADLHHLIRPIDDLGARLHQVDKAFFYSAFHVEEVVG
ncbi:MAG: S-adenosylmethionine--diacylglycerol 3-amino-3-carboxypropyl transferase [Verrucomicrobia bacterium Tous-C9LFEB]|nr:MAG: S-adenosylmethionine--diacylglycerol 3-amino-3-carboxypropyl transferase [Verrucomicrobia bacterium Tous-C9LFEB]